MKTLKCQNLEDTKISEFNQYQRSDKARFIIYADPECKIERIDGCKKNPENLSTAKGFFNVYNILEA